MKKPVLVLFVVVVMGVYVMYSWSHSQNRINPLVELSPDMVEELINSNYPNATFTPYLTYWVSSGHLKKVTTVVYINSTSYIAEVYHQNETVVLKRADKKEVKEYLSFFKQHGGRVYENSSQISNGSTNVMLSAIVPAVVYEK
ncbi:hypothetical protein [Thermococcus sp.]